MHVPDDIDVSQAFEIRLLETSDGHEHGLFIESWADEEETIEAFCERSEYTLDEIEYIGETVGPDIPDGDIYHDCPVISTSPSYVNSTGYVCPQCSRQFKLEDPTVFIQRINEDDQPERREWDGEFDSLEYDAEPVNVGEKVRLTYEDHSQKKCAVIAEAGDIMSHNSWLSFFEADEGRCDSKDTYFIRPDGTIILQTIPDGTICELGQCVTDRKSVV